MGQQASSLSGSRAGLSSSRAPPEVASSYLCSLSDPWRVCKRLLLSSVAEEAFGTEVCQALEIETPAIRLLVFTEPEWGLVKKTLQRLSRGNDGNSIRVKQVRSAHCND
jgi:hypothetical protein